jgi:hypothetical protein
MKTTLIGDIHAGIGEKKTIFHPNFMPDNSIQLGDLCLNSYWNWNVNAKDCISNWKNEKRFFVEGNHECFPELNCNAEKPYSVATGLYHIPRGYINGNVLFIGGANSIDDHRRVAGMDLYPEEALSQAQFNRIATAIENASIDVVIAHDIPACAYPLIGINDHRSNATALQGLFEIAKPSLWVCGHHHRSRQMKADGCKFRILGINEKWETDIPLFSLFDE